MYSITNIYNVTWRLYVVHFISFIHYPSRIVSLGVSLPMSFKLGYSFALRPSLLILPWKSGFLSFGALRCNQMSRRLFDAGMLLLSNCFVRGIDTLAGGDIGESVVARITLTLAVPSSLPKLKNQWPDYQSFRFLSLWIFKFLILMYLEDISTYLYF